MKKWTIEDSNELYNISGWGTSYFGINDKGDIYVTPCKDNVQIDLHDVLDELALRDVTPPVLLRFPDILDNRIEKTWSCFRKASEEYGFKGENFIIYPIKVNQMQPVVEEIISHGRKFNLGLEAGSKPELHAVIAVQCQSDSLIICNGYKDQSYIELALLAQKMGKRIFIVVEKLNELDTISRAAKMATRLMRICYLMCQFFTFQTQAEKHKKLWHKTLGGLRRCDRKARGAYLLSFAETDTTSGARSTRLKYTSMFSAANLLPNSFRLLATLQTDWSLGMMTIRQAPFMTYSSLSNVMLSFLAYLISMCASNGSSSTSTSFFHGTDVTASVCSLPLPST